MLRPCHRKPIHLCLSFNRAQLAPTFCGLAKRFIASSFRNASFFHQGIHPWHKRTFFGFRKPKKKKCIVHINIFCIDAARNKQQEHTMTTVGLSPPPQRKKRRRSRANSSHHHPFFGTTLFHHHQWCSSSSCFPAWEVQILEHRPSSMWRSCLSAKSFFACAPRFRYKKKNWIRFICV